MDQKRKKEILEAALSYLLLNLGDADDTFADQGVEEDTGENVWLAHSGFDTESTHISPVSEDEVQELLAEIKRGDPSRIELSAIDNGHDFRSYHIGCVELPANTTYNEACDKLEELWWTWREEVEHPDADSDFIPWLVENHGWVQAEGNYHYTFGGGGIRDFVQ